MDLWSRLAERLPVKSDAKEAVRYLRERIPQQSDDQRALSQVQLYRIYFTQARERPIFAVPFRRLAQYHLEEALVWAKFWPEPLAIHAALQLQKRDLWSGLENLSKYIQKQRIWLENTGSKESDRLELCRNLALGASARSQLGQFAPALEWCQEAREEFNKLDTGTRVEETGLADSILIGISVCLLVAYRYAEAEAFIDGVLSQKIFSAYPSSAYQHFVAVKELLPQVAALSQGYQSIPQAEELWAALLDEIQRCETPDSARALKDKLLTAIKTHDANRQVQRFAFDVENVMKQQVSVLQTVKPRPLAPTIPIPKPVDLSGISDPAQRADLQKITRATNAAVEAYRRNMKRFDETNRGIFESVERLIKTNINRVQELAERIYRVPLRYRMEWNFWGATRFVVQIVAVGYFLDKLGDSFLEEKGKSLLEVLDVRRKELILLVGMLLIGFVLGHFAEEKIDDWILPKYKRLLTRMVADRSHRLWTSYNTLLQLLANAKQALSDLEKQVQSPPSQMPLPGTVSSP
jgi:hypothetical protein